MVLSRLHRRQEHAGSNPVFPTIRGYSTTVSASAFQAEDVGSIPITRSKYATPCYVTVLAEIVQGKGRTLFVRLGVIRTDGRGSNVTPKVVYVFCRCEDAAQGSPSTIKKKNSEISSPSRI